MTWNGPRFPDRLPMPTDEMNPNTSDDSPWRWLVLLVFLVGLAVIAYGWWAGW